MLDQLDKSLSNEESFDMDYSAGELYALSAERSAVMKQKKNYDLMKGTIPAGRPCGCSNRSN